MAHNGYFSVDKKTKQLVDSDIQKNGEIKGEAKDVDAYDLILKDKQRLLSFEEPTRFIFSHSALSEGWDNPNVFTICTLKNSSNEMRRRQEIGRGLRLCVDKNGERIDDPDICHSINVLTVVPSESYEDFATKLQIEIKDSVSARPTKDDEQYFIGKVVVDSNMETKTIDEAMAKEIYKYLLKNDYINNGDHIIDAYHQAKANNDLAPLSNTLVDYKDCIIRLIDSVYDTTIGLGVDNSRKNELCTPNTNIGKKEFLELWGKINIKSAYTVDFDTDELVQKSIKRIDADLNVAKLEYKITSADLKDTIDFDDLAHGEILEKKSIHAERKTVMPNSTTRYDLLEQVDKNTHLTRHTIASIISEINSARFSLYKSNPEEFISKISNLINEEKATTIVEKITYNAINDTFELDDIFTAEDFDISKHTKLEKHVYDYIKTDCKVEEKFVKKLDKSSDVIVYSKFQEGSLSLRQWVNITMIGQLYLKKVA